MNISVNNKIIDAIVEKLFRKKVKLTFSLTLFKKLKLYRNTTNIFNINLEIVLSGHHSPMIEFIIVLFNYTIIEISIYNTYH